MNKTRWLQKTDFSRLWANTVPWLIFTCARLMRLHLSTTASAAAELSRTGSSKNQHFSEQPPPLISCPLARTSCSVSAFGTHFSSSCSMGSLALASLPQNSWIRPSLFCWQHRLALRVCLLPLVSLAEFCTGCCLRKQHDAAHWHHRLATEPHAAQTPVSFTGCGCFA